MLKDVFFGLCTGYAIVYVGSLLVRLIYAIAGKDIL